MFSRVISAAVYGIDAYIVNVETDVGFGLPTFDMSGALGSKVREAKDRVRVAIKNSGIELTPQKIVINISPANISQMATLVMILILYWNARGLSLHMVQK